MGEGGKALSKEWQKECVCGFGLSLGRERVQGCERRENGGKGKERKGRGLGGRRL